MAVKSIPQKFRTADGSEFDSKQAAARHEKTLTAIDELKAAQKKAVKAIAGECLTADGKPFDFEQRLFYVVQHTYPNQPRLYAIEFWWYSDRIYPADREGAKPCVIHKGDGNGEIRLSIDSLYADRNAAIDAWEIAARKWLEDGKADIDKAQRHYDTHGPDRIY